MDALPTPPLQVRHQTWLPFSGPLCKETGSGAYPAVGLSDNVAVVALVVSLIALTIALGQLSQQLLGTAEGYRRCSETAIGPWHRLRWRHWIWTEFRYETHFITPKIILYPDNDFKALENALALKDVNQEARSPVDSPPFWRRCLFFLPGRNADMVPQALKVLSETIHDDPELKDTQSEVAKPPDDKGRDPEKNASKPNRTLTLQSENKVS